MISLFLDAEGTPSCFKSYANNKEQIQTEDHERAARAFASAASALDSALASVAASHPADRLSALRGEESSLQLELETKRELIKGVAAKIDGWRTRAKEALEKAETAAAASAAGAVPTPRSRTS